MQFKPGHYLAFALSDESRAQILTMFPARFEKVICHHVTLDFNLTAQRLEKFMDLIDPPPIVRAYGYAKGNGVECLAVAIGDHVDRPDGSFYHVTLSLDPPHKPVESNELRDKVVGIRNMFRSVDSLKLEGEFVLLKK
jgi:hypothetical protein